MKRWIRIALSIAGVIVALLLAGALWWALTPLGPSDEALVALEGDEQVSVVESDAGYEFSPASEEPTAALVLYQGGHVDVRSYAPVARDIARGGVLVIVPPMPLSLAVLSPNAAKAAIESHPEISTWIVGGHSLGGAMAAQFANRNAETVAGLLLLAAYPAGNSDLSARKVAVSDVVGTSDGVLSWDAWEAARSLLPADTIVVRIEGGNHAQFGDYGPQPGDNAATISAEEQRAQATDAAQGLFDRVRAAAP